MLRVTAKHVGGARIPQDVQWMRRNNIETIKRFGQPVVWMHAFNEDDLELGGYTFTFDAHQDTIPVKRCPACFDTDYAQSRGDCPVCFGVGIVSEEDHPNRWIDVRGRISDAVTPHPAPKYGGFGPAILTWTIQPDVPEDIFRIGDRGVLTRVQQSTVLAPWTPEMHDNDLLIEVDLEVNSFTVREAHARHVLRQSLPQTLRGFGRQSRGRDFRVGQTFQMNKLPRGHILFNVPMYEIYVDTSTATATAAISALESGPTYDNATVRVYAEVSGEEEYEQA